MGWAPRATDSQIRQHAVVVWLRPRFAASHVGRWLSTRCYASLGYDKGYALERFVKLPTIAAAHRDTSALALVGDDLPKYSTRACRALPRDAALA